MGLESHVLAGLHRMMMTIRVCEESFVPLILDGTIRCPVHLCTGQEAIATGVCAALTESDYIFGTHRSHGHFLAKGGSLKELVAEVYCRESGCSAGRGGSMHVVAPDKGMLGSAPIVGGTISLALGAALAAQIRGDGRTVVAFFGDGATGEGVLYEAMNFAALRRLPLIFACENNLYSTHMPIREIRVDVEISAIAKPFGIPAYRVDGNDLLLVHDAAAAAVAACQAGRGPAFLEFLTYRLRGHVGPSDNIQGTQADIRSLLEIEQWRTRDPIGRFERYLLSNHHITEHDLAGIRDEVTREVEEAHAFARDSARPETRDLAKYVFSH
jgi:pyruvate dehydrogenase E1 component alpha subunit